MRTLLPLLLVACASETELISQPPNVHPGEVTECDFSQVEETDFWSYDCNPVFSSTDEGWASSMGSSSFVVTEVMGHAFFQLFYVGWAAEERDGNYGLGYAISPDGTNWSSNGKNPIIEPSAPSDWDGTGIAAPSVIWDTETQQYVMLYQGYNLDPNNLQAAMGVATSTDGQSWSRFPLNPVLDMLSPTGNVNSWCWPLGLTEGAVGGFNGYMAGNRNNKSACEVFQLTAADITSWEPQTNVVLAAGDSGEWDDEGFTSLAIVELEGTDYLFYVGFGKWENFGSYQETRKSYLGMATSDDGRSWTKSGDIIPINNTNAGHVGSVAAASIGGRIHLWVSDRYDDSNAVGYFLYDPYLTRDAK
jgi:hypothetical protein